MTEKTGLKYLTDRLTETDRHMYVTESHNQATYEANKAKHTHLICTLPFSHLHHNLSRRGVGIESTPLKPAGTAGQRHAVVAFHLHCGPLLGHADVLPAIFLGKEVSTHEFQGVDELTTAHGHVEEVGEGWLVIWANQSALLILMEEKKDLVKTLKNGHSEIGLSTEVQCT